MTSRATAQELAKVLGVDGGRDRHQRATERLGDRHDVGHDAEVLAGEPLARASHARLDLVEDQERADPVAGRSDRAKVVRGWHDDPALALHRLEDDGGGLRIDAGLDRGDVTEGNPLETRHERLERLAERLASGRREREPGVTVVAVDARDDLGSTGRAPSEFQGEVHGLAATGAKGRARQTRRRDLRQLLGQGGLLARAEKEVAVVEFVDRDVRRLHDPRIAPPHVERTSRSEAVEEAPPIEVPHPHALTLRFDDVEPGRLQHPHLLGIHERGEVLEGRRLGRRVGYEVHLWSIGHGAPPVRLDSPTYRMVTTPTSSHESRARAKHVLSPEPPRARCPIWSS
jgi:hypothetical protein